MMNKINFSGLTIYKKYYTLQRDSYVLRKLFCQPTSSLLPFQIPQYALIYYLPHESG